MQIKTPNSPNSANSQLVTNINWDKDINGLRKVELDDFHSQSSNNTFANPIDGALGLSTNDRVTTNKIDLFLVRKRTIKLFDLWNRIINSGLFDPGIVSPRTISYKNVGSNIRNLSHEYLIKDWNNAGTYTFPVALETSKVFYRIIRFLKACAQNHGYYMINGTTNKTYFLLTNTNAAEELNYYINPTYDPTTDFISLMDELIVIVKSLLDETKLTTELNLTFNDLYFSTEQGREAILTLDTYNSKYNLIGKTDSSYLDSNIIPQDKTLLYPQFGSLMSRNTESETWNTRNVILDTSTYNPENNPDLNIYRKPSKIVCSQLKMDKPIKINTAQYINWSDSDDEPYVMVYNGGTFIHLPDEIKTNSYQPDNQLNIAAKFWKIGTQDTTDPKYNSLDDVKLNLGHPLTDLTKLDYFDNLTLYMKLD